MGSLIEIRDLKKIYSAGEEPVAALDGVSLTIENGEFVAIMGASGSGKSTMLNILGCLDVPTSGSYLLDGIEVAKRSRRELAIIRNRKLGFVFQNFNLLTRMTAYENVALPLIYQGVNAAERKKRAMEALEQVGLAARAQHKPTELSGGQQQRVAVARALAAKPSLILADEPTGNLDSKTGADIMDLFCSLNDAGITIVLITHSEKVAAQAKRRIRIMDGHVTECGDDTAPFASAQKAGEQA